ncbi:sensor histidine kinase [Paenibacillus sp. SC116]|uniref:sensor histidine kinase n=1 Tax=Paenibacillus sp. SC116 TaxID=2968986 RepID=UPI00215A79B3|nr:sensor histidine kinase [Paenibacillus sp. SC116]MCR8843222.1 sensor histidine kinase [Paenibacillus sp. SC116]
MSFWKYVKDRFLLIFAWLLSLVMSLIVVHFDIQIGARTIRHSSLVYVFVLGVFIVGVGIIYDYLRQREWYKEINYARMHENDNEFSLCLQHPVTEEQQVMYQLMQRQYSAFMDQIMLMRQQREQHVHFTNQWVHHMKTPVSVLHLITQQPAQRMDEEEARLLLANVSEETDRLTGGLELMLHTARLDKFELDLHVSQVPLHENIRQVINQHKKMFIRYRIFPKVIGEDRRVESDSKWLNFIVTQLVTNAIKYSKDKEGSKSLNFEIEENDETVWLHVLDEGIGIAPHDIPRVFEPFFTGENGRKEGDATGMGLYLVKQVCNRLGHRIQITSEIGSGTKVSIGFESHTIHKGYF